jgi:hypothetical protein
MPSSNSSKVTNSCKRGGGKELEWMSEREKAHNTKNCNYNFLPSSLSLSLPRSFVVTALCLLLLEFARGVKKEGEETRREEKNVCEYRASEGREKEIYMWGFYIIISERRYKSGRNC